MTLDLSYRRGPPPDVVAVAWTRGRTVETWAMEGSTGDRVHIDAHLPDDPQRVVVMAHGADNSRKARYIEVSAKWLTRSGTAVITMDAPGHGDRDDAVVIADPIGIRVDLLVHSVRDHRRLLDGVAARWPMLPVGYAGFSMGALHGVPLLAVEERIAAAVLVVAGSTQVSYPIRFGAIDPSTAAALRLTDPAVHAADVTNRPVLLLNAVDDEVVPVEAAEALHKAFPGPAEIVLMPGTHTEWGDAADWYRHLDEFFREKL